MREDSIFIEQAEYINTDLFQKWNIEHPDEGIIIKKLSQGGAKLITGPRGCGKTTLMLKTYYNLCSKKKGTTLAIYVNFKTSLKIEPLYRKNINASYWFNQWLLFKIYQGLYKTLEDINIEAPNDLLLKKVQIDDVVNKIELGFTEKISTETILTISMLEEEIKKIFSCTNKSHCVLLLDDAAHAFSVEQQYDFFEFFRQIKSRIISPKAAIYPGITNFSPTFHVGHDAEEIDVWIKPEINNYVQFMLQILERRLPRVVYNKLSEDLDLLYIICYSSFGIPRALLNIVRNFYKDKTVDGVEKFEVKFTRKTVMSAINQTFIQVMSIFLSLKEKLPIYEKFIVTGEQIFIKMIDEIKEYNKEKGLDEQGVTIAIKKPLPSELSKVIEFFQYAGLVMYKKELSKGEKGVFELYNIHYAGLVERNAFMGKKAIKSIDLAIALRKRNAHSFKRITSRVLIGTEDIRSIFPLSLPPCPVCGTPRASEHTKFCGECGAPLKTASIFEELVSNDINKLPLTAKRVQSIKKYSRIRTIKDILMDNDNKELRGVPQIGPYWADKIYSYAEEYIG
ncbi:hypothetical protein [Clostridium sp. ZS2-4]|uniref:hypothetical protein n=1 Tax=Clostridium sp. ZS2-4 TaxID=2987703 RepID=UPI00227A79BA|nr:hypothetical protein [Clostridium sp. ZS2-4]MCY6356003.1 hypothetical protein [Clostridium sp. ZS2-4]